MKRDEEESGMNLQQSTALSHIPRTLCEIHDHDTYTIRVCIHENDSTEAETDAAPAGLATDTKPMVDYRESLDGIITNHSQQLQHVKSKRGWRWQKGTGIVMGQHGVSCGLLRGEEGTRNLMVYK